MYPLSQWRRNSYDGELEYFVVLRESGKRQEESSYEEEHRKRAKALKQKGCSITPLHILFQCCWFQLKWWVSFFLPKPSQCITSNYLPQGDSDPTSDLGTGFSGLDAMGKRDATEKDKGLDRPELTKYMQDRFLKLYIYYAVCQFHLLK